MCSIRNVYRDGVMTLELSLLMPGILSVIILIIFTGYYYHDRCIIERGAYSTSLKCAQEAILSEDECTDDLESKMLQYFEEETRDRLIGKWDLNINADNTLDEISIRVNGNMSCLDGLFSIYLSRLVYSIDIEESSFKMDYGYIYQ